MIVVDRPKLRFLLAGRAIDVDVTREYRKGRDYAVGVSAKRSVCRARVENIVELPEGFRLTIRQAAEEKPRWLARQGVQADYTSEVSKAVLEEPEALSAEELAELAKYAAARHQARQQAPSLSIVDRVVLELDDALRSSLSRSDRDKIRGAQRLLGKVGT